MKRIKTKKIVSLLRTFMWVILSIGVLAGCGARNNGAPGKAGHDDPEPIRVGLLRIDDSFPFYVARQAGLFEKHGVDVELYEFSSARDQSAALQGGELDVIMTDPVVTALSIKGGNDLRIVATALGADPQEGRFLIVAAPGSNITSPEQLAGKNLAISNNTMMDYLTCQYMQALNVDLSGINLVNMPDLMLRTTTLLEGKDIDAAILPDPLAAYAVMEGAYAVIDDTRFAENFSQSVVSVTKEKLSRDPHQISAMLDAYNEAIELINENPEEYRESALEFANVPQSLRDTYPTPTFTARAVPDETCIVSVNEWMVKQGLLDKPFTYEEMVDVSFSDP